MLEAPLADATVLLVEDEALLRRQLTAHLERAGADVTVAGDLAGARALLAGEAFTFARLDVNLPDGRGTDPLREGAFAAGTAVIVMTAEGGVEAAEPPPVLGRFKKCRSRWKSRMNRRPRGRYGLRRKRSAPPLWLGRRTVCARPARVRPSKAVAALRSATAVHDAADCRTRSPIQRLQF